MIDPDDSVRAYLNVKTLKDEEFINNNYILMVTRQGVVKKTTLEAYSRPRTNGVNAINIREDDELLEAILTNGRCNIMIAANGGRCVRFDETEARPLGRTSTGVRGINLDEGDFVVSVVCQDLEAEDAARHQYWPYRRTATANVRSSLTTVRPPAVPRVSAPSTSRRKPAAWSPSRTSRTRTTS